MADRKIETHSLPVALEETKVNWEIYEWGGPRADLMRSQACCLVNVMDTRLRFHLRSFSCLDDPVIKFCSGNKEFGFAKESHCGECYKCTTFQPLKSTPVEHYPPGNVKSSGYSLLVDVLSPIKKKLTFGIFAEMPEGKFRPKNSFVTLEPGQPQSNVVAIDKFYRTAMWTVDPKGIVKNYHALESEIYAVKFHLCVTLYQVDNRGTDGDWAEEQEKMAALENDVGKLKMDDVSDIALITKDGVTINANKFLLEEQSPYFKRCFEKHPSSLSGFYVDVNAKALEGILNWMTTDRILSEHVPWLEEICKAAVWLELTGIWKHLDKHLVSFCTPENMHQLHELAEKHELKQAIVETAEYIKRNEKKLNKVIEQEIVVRGTVEEDPPF